MTAHYYHINYKGNGADHIMILTNGEESYFFSDGFFGYKLIFRFSNIVDDIISFLRKKGSIEKITLEKVDYNSLYEPDREMPIIDIKKCRVPNEKERGWLIME